MLIILPNLKHSFISPVPVLVPVPDFWVFHAPPQIPQMIPSENEEWHGICSSGRGFNSQHKYRSKS